MYVVRAICPTPNNYTRFFYLSLYKSKYSMKQYHYSDGVNSYGPISLEELRTKNINPDTLIWTEELVTWKKAKEIPELQDLFRNISNPPPPSQFGGTQHYSGQSQQGNTQNFQRPPKTYLLESILTTIFCCWPLGIPSIIYASRVEKKFYAGDIAGAEEDSANAKKWMIVNLIACVVLWIAYFGFFGLAIFGGLINGY